MRFRFTIRDLLWLTALVAVLLAWWIDRTSVMNRYKAAFRELRNHDMQNITWSWGFMNDPKWNPNVNR